jgi:hypothetical protein
MTESKMYCSFIYVQSVDSALPRIDTPHHWSGDGGVRRGQSYSCEQQNITRMALPEALHQASTPAHLVVITLAFYLRLILVDA